LKKLYCADDPALYDKWLIRPVGQIDRQAIVNEKAHIDSIVATLGVKEMTQGTLIRKLCTDTAPNPTRRAIFELDKLVRSLYTLRYLRKPAVAAPRAPFAEPHRVLPSATLDHRSGRRQRRS
jgi:TnpA family transposase